MVGTWKLGERKVRPGTYFRTEAVGVVTEGAINGIAAMLISSNWGPLNKIFDVDQTMLNNLGEYYGTGDGVDAVKEALLGGATTVKVIRVGGDKDAVAPKCTLYLSDKPVSANKWFKQNGTDTINIYNKYYRKYIKNSDCTATGKLTWKVKFAGKWLTPKTDYKITLVNDGTNYTTMTLKLTEDGMTKVRAAGTKWKFGVYKSYTLKGAAGAKIYGRFVGDREFTCAVKTDLISGFRQFLVYDGDILFDSVRFEPGGDEVAKLVEALNTNRNFKATASNSGTLNDVTGTLITGGVNPKINVAAYSAGTDVLERSYWNTVMADKDSAAIKSLLSEFVKMSYETGRLGIAVIAGKSSEGWAEDTVSSVARINYCNALNDWRIVYIPTGWIDINGVKFEGWRAAARIGGMIAAVETNASLTHIVIQNALELIEPKTHGEITQAEQKGCFMFSLNDDDQIWIDNAITTFTTLDNEHDQGWEKVRRTKCRFELMTRVNRTCEKLVGRLNNDENGRATIITAMNSIINEMIGEGKLFSGSYAHEDPRYTPEGDRAWFVLDIDDIDSMEKLYLTYRFSYGRRLA